MTKEAKPDVWMPLYIGDYLKDTGRLTTEQHGAYLLLIMEYWNTGPIPDSDEELAGIVRMSRRDWQRIRPKIERFFAVVEGAWRHDRIEREITKWSAKKARAVERARAGGIAKAALSTKKAAKSSATSTQQAVLKQCSSPSKVERGINSLSTLTDREIADERADGSSASRSVVVDFVEVRDEIAEAERQREKDAARDGLKALAASLGKTRETA